MDVFVKLTWSFNNQCKIPATVLTFCGRAHFMEQITGIEPIVRLRLETILAFE